MWRADSLAALAGYIFLGVSLSTMDTVLNIIAAAIAIIAGGWHLWQEAHRHR